MAPLLEIRNVSKNFVGIKALERIDFQINLKERVGLIGDNGAGKSTLIKIRAFCMRAPPRCEFVEQASIIGRLAILGSVPSGCCFTMHWNADLAQKQTFVVGAVGTRCEGCTVGFARLT